MEESTTRIVTILYLPVKCAVYENTALHVLNKYSAVMLIEINKLSLLFFPCTYMDLQKSIVVNRCYTTICPYYIMINVQLTVAIYSVMVKTNHLV